MKHMLIFYAVLALGERLLTLENTPNMVVTVKDNILTLSRPLAPKFSWQKTLIHKRMLFFKEHGKLYTIVTYIDNIEAKVIERKPEKTTTNFLVKKREIDVFHLGDDDNADKGSKLKDMKDKANQIHDKLQDKLKEKGNEMHTKPKLWNPKASQATDMGQGERHNKPFNWDATPGESDNAANINEKRSEESKFADKIREAFTFKGKDESEKKGEITADDVHRLLEVIKSGDINKPETSANIFKSLEERREKSKKAKDKRGEELKKVKGNKTQDANDEEEIHLIESDSAVDENGTFQSQKVRVFEIGDGKFKLKSDDNQCLTFFNGNFVIVACNEHNSNQVFKIKNSNAFVKEEAADKKSQLKQERNIISEERKDLMARKKLDERNFGEFSEERDPERAYRKSKIRISHESPDDIYLEPERKRRKSIELLQDDDDDDESKSPRLSSLSRLARIKMKSLPKWKPPFSANNPYLLKNMMGGVESLEQHDSHSLINPSNIDIAKNDSVDVIPTMSPNIHKPLIPKLNLSSMKFSGLKWPGLGPSEIKKEPVKTTEVLKKSSFSFGKEPQHISPGTSTGQLNITDVKELNVSNNKNKGLSLASKQENISFKEQPLSTLLKPKIVETKIQEIVAKGPETAIKNEGKKMGIDLGIFDPSPIEHDIGSDGGTSILDKLRRSIEDAKYNEV